MSKTRLIYLLEIDNMINIKRVTKYASLSTPAFVFYYLHKTTCIEPLVGPQMTRRPLPSRPEHFTEARCVAFWKGELLKMILQSVSLFSSLPFIVITKKFVS